MFSMSQGCWETKMQAFSKGREQVTASESLVIMKWVSFLGQFSETHWILMYSKIFCSNSPGTLSSLRTIFRFLYSEFFIKISAIKFCLMCSERSCKNWEPARAKLVLIFWLTNFQISSLISFFCDCHCFRIVSLFWMSITWSRSERWFWVLVWFNFALGRVPSRERQTRFLGS